MDESETHHLQPSCLVLHWQHVELQCPNSATRRGWAPTCLDRPRAHLQIPRMLATIGTTRSVRISRTSLRDFSECQTGAPLEIDIIGIDEGAQGPKGFTGEEVGLGPLSKNTCEQKRFPGGAEAALEGATAMNVRFQGNLEDRKLLRARCLPRWFHKCHPLSGLRSGRDKLRYGTIGQLSRSRTDRRS